MLGMPVFMLTIGKISEGSHTISNMRGSSVLNGRRKTLCKPMPMAAKMNTGADFLMDGRSKNIIPSTIKCTHAGKMRAVRSPIALTIIQRGIADTS
jgi:hypothetical protein